MRKQSKFVRRFVVSGFLIAILCLAMATLALAAGDTTAPIVTSVVPANGSTIYTNGTSTVTSISADYSDETGGSGVDSTSVMVHLDGDHMLFDCPHPDGCPCPV